jgi:hypothetical protein
MHAPLSLNALDTLKLVTLSHCLEKQAANVLLRSNESEDRGVSCKISDFGMTFQASGEGRVAQLAPLIT